ncbi:helix-turn-helix transcriptional regulator [Tsukamurella conjunctivitidis]|uniref:Helix-turn-helix transcriptional regulator n=1 Tax=Tsukamurella conjunctivitidis TaxID=2592068 RepID=A0A5C5S0R5_9ACTN|nr:helix-turn-helix transcriptional regulator [Tsukamurella conjunctivitidis]TWS29017.1 helix-turn-helix transcriptional regulator [Tsukamurella conjunctivitidis]
MNRRIARGIAKIRGDRSAQWLSDSTAEIGHRVSRETISNYENGRKKVLDVADLLVIAQALDVGLIDLLLPDPGDSDVWESPVHQASATEAARNLQRTNLHWPAFRLQSMIDGFVQASRAADDHTLPADERRRAAATAVTFGESALERYDRMNPKVWPQVLVDREFTKSDLAYELSIMRAWAEFEDE